MRVDRNKLDERLAARVAEIRGVYERGYLTRREFESIKRNLEARAKRTRPRRAA
jgi:hypothetical protein